MGKHCEPKRTIEYVLDHPVQQIYVSPRQKAVVKEELRTCEVLRVVKSSE